MFRAQFWEHYAVWLITDLTATVRWEETTKKIKILNIQSFGLRSNVVGHDLCQKTASSGDQRQRHVTSIQKCWRADNGRVVNIQWFCFQIISEILQIRSPFVAAAAGSWDPVTILRQHWSIKVFVIISTRAAIKYYWVMTSEGNCSPRHPSVRPPICGHCGLIARIVSWNDLNRDQGIRLRLDSEFE